MQCEKNEYGNEENETQGFYSEQAHIDSKHSRNTFDMLAAR